MTEINKKFSCCFGKEKDAFFILMVIKFYWLFNTNLTALSLRITFCDLSKLCAGEDKHLKNIS